MAYSYLRRARQTPAYKGYESDLGTDARAFMGYDRYAWVDSVAKGDAVPNWKRRIARLQSATTYLIGERYKVDLKGGYFSYTQKNGNITTETYQTGLMGYKPSFPSANSLSETKANNSALSSFVKRANSAVNHFQGSVAVGELAETLRMIKNPAQSFRRGLDDYLKNVKKRTSSRRNVQGKRPSARDLRRIVADTWLEHAFGWTPLVSDVRTAAETLARRRHEWRRETVPIRAGGSSQTVTFAGPSSGLYGSLIWYAGHRTLSEVNVKYYGVVKREVYNDYQWDMNLFGFNPNQFIPTAWELIPYSFLVDYFTNIGEIINGYAFNRSMIAWVNKGVKKSAKLEAWWQLRWKEIKDYYEPTAIKFIGYREESPKLVLEHITVTRDAYSGSFVPTLEFEIPGLGTKWINLAALAFGHADARRSIARLG